MSQIKDIARRVPAQQNSPSHRTIGPNAIDGQISGLLTRRAQLLEQLAQVDRKLAELRRSAREERAARDGPEVGWFSMRGEQAEAARLAVPRAVDEEDVRRRLQTVLVEERAAGRPVDGLEVLVAFEPGAGRVVAVQTRRPGQLDWVRRFQSADLGAGH